MESDKVGNVGLWLVSCSLYSLLLFSRQCRVLRTGVFAVAVRLHGRMLGEILRSHST